MTAVRGLTLTICSFVALAACSGSESAPASGPLVTTTPAITTTVAPTTSVVPPTTTTTTTVSTTSTIAVTPVLDDGRPATFMAVTDDYEAVEVDTETGEIIHRFGQRAGADALASGDEIAPNVFDGIWRTASGDTVLISECCEPAGGHISFLTGDEPLNSDYENEASHGWWVVPSAHSDQVIITGYFTEIRDASQAPSTTDSVVLFENDGSGVGAIGWSLDGTSIYWFDEGSGDLTTWNQIDGRFSLGSKVSIEWVASDQHLFGLDTQANGNLVSFLTRFDAEGEPSETEGVVYSSETGELLAMFPVPAGSSFGGYDVSGRFLVYTTRDGVVMYQGLGQVGVLGVGYLFASW